MIQRIDIIGQNGTPMRAIRVEAGKQSPNRPAMKTCDKDIVEFYDMRYTHTPDGQFICDYYVETFQDYNHGCGLDLMGYASDWKIDILTRNIVSDWLAYLRKERVMHNERFCMDS